MSKREAIKDCFITMASYLGYEATTFKLMAEQVGSCNALITQHFGTKIDLLTECLGDISVRLYEQTATEDDVRLICQLSFTDEDRNWLNQCGITTSQIRNCWKARGKEI